MTFARLVWANLRRQPARTLLVVAAVAIAFALYGLALGIAEGFRLAALERHLPMQSSVTAVAMAIAAISLLPILGLTASAMVHTIRGRIAELALLRALGYSQARVLSLLIAETGAPCVFGTLLGLAGGKFVFWSMATALPALGVLPAPVYTPSMIVSAIGLALLVAFASAAIPVRRLAGSPLIASLRGVPASVPERALVNACAPPGGSAPHAPSFAHTNTTFRRPSFDLSLVSQIAVVTRIGLSTLRLRLKGVLLIVGSIGTIVFLLLLPLTALESIRVAVTRSGDPARVVVRSRTGVLLDQSRTPDGLAEMLADAPGVATTRTGAPMIDTEIYGWPRGLIIRHSGEKGHSPLVGVGTQWTQMTPSFRLLTGRMPRPQAHEILAGTLAAQKFENLDTGTVTFGDVEWRIVGTFTTDDWWDGYLVGNAADLAPVAPASAGTAVRVRLSSPQAFDAFRNAMATRLPPSLMLERETDYYTSFWRRVPKHLFYIALVLASLMSAGAALATTLVMESALEDRRRELATLRLLGFDERAVAAAVLLEGLILATGAALAGLAAVWLVMDGRIMNGAWGVLRIGVDGWLLLFALGWGAGIAIAGTSVLALRMLKATALDAIRDLWMSRIIPACRHGLSGCLRRERPSDEPGAATGAIGHGCVGSPAMKASISRITSASFEFHTL